MIRHASDLFSTHPVHKLPPPPSPIPSPLYRLAKLFLSHVSSETHTHTDKHTNTTTTSIDCFPSFDTGGSFRTCFGASGSYKSRGDFTSQGAVLKRLTPFSFLPAYFLTRVYFRLGQSPPLPPPTHLLTLQRQQLLCVFVSIHFLRNSSPYIHPLKSCNCHTFVCLFKTSFKLTQRR